jgi:phage gp36-like protein
VAYCTETDVQIAAGGPAKLLELVDQDGNGTADDGVLDAAIEAAQAEMDPYLEKQVKVPLSDPIPSDVKWRCAKLAVLFLREARGSVSDEHIKEREQHVAWLDGVASGKIALAVDPQPTKSTMRLDAAKKPTLRVRTREKLKGSW